MSKKVAISQSNYIPWKGYFDLINSADVFVVYDDMQYTKNDWRNRNKIKTAQGLQWLTIPVRVHSLSQLIKETGISDGRWHAKHWRAISQSYSKSEYFHLYRDELEHLYNESAPEYSLLSDVNLLFLKHVCKTLNIATEIVSSSDFQLAGGKSEKVLGICKDLNASVYVSGPSARDYLDVGLFSDEGIEVEWMDYNNYPVYQQLYGGFEPAVSIVDLIFNAGPDAPGYMKSFTE